MGQGYCRIWLVATRRRPLPPCAKVGEVQLDGDDGGGRGRRLRLRGLVGGGGMALNGEEGRRRVNNERVERCAAASETSLEMYVRVGVTEWKVETRRRAHEVGGRGSEHEEGPRHRFRVLLLQVTILRLKPYVSIGFAPFKFSGCPLVVWLKPFAPPDAHRISRTTSGRLSGGPRVARCRCSVPLRSLSKSRV